MATSEEVREAHQAWLRSDGDPEYRMRMALDAAAAVQPRWRDVKTEAAK